MSSYDTLHAWLYANEKLPALGLDEEKLALLQHQLNEALPTVIEAIGAEAKAIVDRKANNGSRPLPAEQLPPTPVAQKTDWSDDEICAFAERHDRTPVDFKRKWFEEVEGGYEHSTAEDRVAVMAKAENWFKQRETPQPNTANTQPRPQGTRPWQPRQGGGGQRKQFVPCPDCGEDRIVETQWGVKYRCDEHNYWSGAQRQ